jgi:hypothetical protein
VKTKEALPTFSIKRISSTIATAVGEVAVNEVTPKTYKGGNEY